MSKLLEEILSKDNIDLAIKRVKSNKGAPGVDSMTANEVENYFKDNGEGGKHYAIETETGEITKGNIGQYRTGKQESKSNKQKQLDYILKTNPMRDDYHTGIRELSDVKTFEEALDYEEPTYPDITEDIIENAKKTGKIKVYSSKDIKGGGFITPSKMMAKDYAGGGDVKELEVDIDDVAWINGDEGVYAPKSELGGEVKKVEMPEKQRKALDAVIKKTANLKNEQSRIIDTDGNILVLVQKL